MADQKPRVAQIALQVGTVKIELQSDVRFRRIVAQIENVVAQMLTANGRKLYFHMQKSKDEAKNRMEVDFLIAKSKVQRRKNISAIEVKSGKNYTLGSLGKCCEKYGQYIDVPYVLHSKDVKVENGITCLPLYMTPCL